MGVSSELTSTDAGLSYIIRLPLRWKKYQLH